MYELTAAGRERVQRWLADVTWSKVAPVEFHLKLVVAATTRLADPVALVDAQRLELLRELHQLQALALKSGRRRRRPPAGGRVAAPAGRHPLARGVRAALGREGVAMSTADADENADGTEVRQ